MVPDGDADQLAQDNEELAAEVAMLKGILAETLSRRRLEAARMRVLNAGLVATKEFIQQDAMQLSVKAVRMGAADAASAAVMALTEQEGTAVALENLGESEQLAQMREMEAAMNGGGEGAGAGAGAAAPPRIINVDDVIEFEFGHAFKDPMWDEIIGDREHTIRGLRELLVKFVAHHDVDEVISKFKATTVKKEKFVELYRSLPGDHTMVDGHAAMVFSAFNPEDDSDTAELNYNAYFVCFAIAAQGNEREKLQTMFALFDTDGSGELAGTEIEVIARALGSITGVMGQIDETTVAKALMAFGAFSGGEVDEEQFIEKCLEDPALSKLVQRAFLVVLAKPPLAQGAMSKFTQQATVARRKADGLRDAQQAAATAAAAVSVSETIVEEGEEDAESISSAAEAAEAAEIAKLEREVQAKKSNLERKKSIKSQQKEQEAAAAVARKSAEAARQKEVDAAQRKAAALKAEEDVLLAKKQAEFQKKQDEDNAKMRAKQEEERQKRIAIAAEQQKKADAEKAAAAAAAAAAEKKKGMEEIAKQKLAGNIKAATKDNELDDYYAHQEAAPDVDVDSEAYRRAMIEKAEREAIAEMTGGSDMNNDDAILAAMAATQGTLKRGATAGGSGGGPLASLASPGMSIIPDPIDEAPPAAAAAGGARIVMPDADYLLSMIMTGIDEEAEQQDGEGRRFHVNNDGVPTYREQDVMQRPFGGPLQNTLSRRDKATTDVERRRAEAEARKKEAQMRSLGRNASARSKETAF
eukprot:gene6465-2222_t